MKRSHKSLEPAWGQFYFRKWTCNIQNSKVVLEVGWSRTELSLWLQLSQDWWSHRTVGFTSSSCCCSWDSPRILLWKLCPVMNLLWVISTLKDLVVVSENSVFTGFETQVSVDWQGCGFPWSALSWSRTPFPELCPTVFCPTHAQVQAAYGELHSSNEFEGKTWYECYGLVFFLFKLGLGCLLVMK